jgi:DNA-binding GntR family transcriptional regulator
MLVGPAPTPPAYASRVGMPSNATRGGVGSGRLNDAVYETLKERLLDGQYQPGERLSAEGLRAEFDVSRQPAMEALRRLASEGMIRIVPQVGSMVATYTEQEVEDFFYMFGTLEGSVAALAARRWTDDQLRALDQSSDTPVDLHLETDPVIRARAFRLSYRRFHGVVHAMAHAPFVADTVSKMWDLSDFLISTALADRPLTDVMEARNHEHDAIRDALAARDAHLARTTSEQHIHGLVSVLRGQQRTSID